MFDIVLLMLLMTTTLTECASYLTMLLVNVNGYSIKNLSKTCLYGLNLTFTIST